MTLKSVIFTRCYLCQPLLCMGWTGETWLRKACRGSCSERFDHLVLKYLKSISERILASISYSSLNWALLTVLQKKSLSYSIGKLFKSNGNITQPFHFPPDRLIYLHPFKIGNHDPEIVHLMYFSIICIFPDWKRTARFLLLLATPHLRNLEPKSSEQID